MPLPGHIYLHVPFCARRCSYCDFAIAVRREVPAAEYVEAVGRELSLRCRRGADWCVDTVYLGGGTPSRLGAEALTRVLDLLREYVQPRPNCEVTLEANPDDVSVDHVRAWRGSGVNRLSIGSQSFDAATLAWMHRTHGVSQIDEAVAVARGEGIENVSLDLIFAVPRELGRSWQHDLARALELAPSHISVYGLTVEPGTPLGRWRERKVVVEASEESYEEEFLLAHRMLTSAGYEHYEVSSYALPGWQSRHNTAYWQDRAYLGLGPSAHSYDGRVRRWNVGAYAAWARRVADGTDPKAGDELLRPEQRLSEQVYVRLRTTEGVEIHPSAVWRVRPWIDAGWAELDGLRLRLTALGWLRLDALATSLTEHVRC